MILASLVIFITNFIHWLLKWFIKEKTLLEWKPIHLCWWFRKHNLPIPKYFIGKTAFTPNLNKFRFYEDGSEDGSTPIANENTNITRTITSDSNLHLRVLIQESGGGTSGATSDDWQLQYEKNDSGSWVNVTTTSACIKGYNSSSLTDAAVTTNRSTNGISDGSGSFVAGEISETGLITDRQLTLSNFTEFLYSLTVVASEVVNGDTYDFRVLWKGGTFTYNVTPRITIAKAPSAPTNVSATDGTDTSKVVVTWTKSAGATGYKVYEGSNLLATLGDVATYDDSAAPAPTITGGTADASDGTSSDHVVLSLSGESANVGSSRTYKVRATNATGDSGDSNTDTGYIGVGSLGYQWYRSAGDSDASYSEISGATTNPYNDTGAPADGSGRYYKCYLTATGATPTYSSVDRGQRSVPTNLVLMIISNA